MVRSKYGNINNIMSRYSPDNIRTMVQTHGKAGMINADTPSLTIMKYAFGDKAVNTFLGVHLFETAKFYGMTDKADMSAMYQIADLIILDYYYLKISELVLFFQMLKAGHFRDSNDNDRGKMYGSFNGEVIMDCLYKFKQERDKYLDEKKSEENKKNYDRMVQESATKSERKEALQKGLKEHPENAQMLLSLGWITKEDLIELGLSLPEREKSEEEIRKEHERVFWELLKKQ